MVEYRTQDGDTADIIAYKYYGDQAGAVVALFNANPGLAAKGDIFTAGIVVKLPELEKAVTSTVRLWGSA
jgi:phage tail protein X